MSVAVEQELEAKYGLPQEVKFCRRCVLSNQVPRTTCEFQFRKDTRKETTFFDEEGICPACRYAELAETAVDWTARENELRQLCDRYRKNDGSYDCIVPGSGGKDSGFVAHLLKHKFGMHPLTVTWAPHIYTDIGWQNFQSWIHSGFDNILITPNGRVHRLLTRLAFENLLHPFQPFVIGQKGAIVRMARQRRIPLVFYGDGPLDDVNQKGFPKHHFCSDGNLANTYLGGVSIPDLIRDHGLTLNDLYAYLPMTHDDLEGFPLEYAFLSYYVKWDPMETYRYAAANTGFKPKPERSEATYTDYASLDDRIDGLHYFTSLIKFGMGRASRDAAVDIRNHRMTREQGVTLAEQYDREFPKRYFREDLEYMGITEERFWECINAGRSAHLWKYENGQWQLRRAVWFE